MAIERFNWINRLQNIDKHCIIKVNQIAWQRAKRIMSPQSTLWRVEEEAAINWSKRDFPLIKLLDKELKV